MFLLKLALLPVFICAFKLFHFDKYEKEPLYLLIISMVAGFLSTFPIVYIEGIISDVMPFISHNFTAFYTAFLVASLVEESFKFIIFLFILRNNNNYNEPFDAIIYAGFISLGFALFENLMYVFSPTRGGFETAILRAFLSIPAHSIFGVNMGYYFSGYKLSDKKIYLFLSFFIPFIFHGIYDFILFSGFFLYEIFFALFVIFLWTNAFYKIKNTVKLSPFK